MHYANTQRIKMTASIFCVGHFYKVESNTKHMYQMSKQFYFWDEQMQNFDRIEI